MSGSIVLNRDASFKLPRPGDPARVTVDIGGRRLYISPQALALCSFVCTRRTEGEVLDFAKYSLCMELSDIELLLSALRAHGLLVAGDHHERDHWYENGWSEALALLQAARHSKFAEAQDGADRGTLLTGMVNKEGWPPTASLPTTDEASAVRLPNCAIGGTLLEALSNRRTVRELRPGEIGADVVGSILTMSSRRIRLNRELYASATVENPLPLLESFGCAIELYPIIFDVSGCASGVYHFDPLKGALDLTSHQMSEDELRSAIVGQRMAKSTSFAVVVTAAFVRQQWRYRSSRGYQNLLVNAGEVANMLVFAGAAMGVAQWLTPALQDSQLDCRLGLDSQFEQSLYVVGFGTPRRSEASIGMGHVETGRHRQEANP